MSSPGASQAFRVPNLSDLTRFDIAQTGELETPQPNLRPEHFLTLESGVKVQQGRFTAQAGYFHTLVSDLIVRTPTGAVIGGLTEVTKLNSGSGHTHGIEFDGSFNLTPAWTLRASATWMKGWLDVFPATAGAAKQREPASKLMPATTQLSLNTRRRAGVGGPRRARPSPRSRTASPPLTCATRNASRPVARRASPCITSARAGRWWRDSA